MAEAEGEDQVVLDLARENRTQNQQIALSQDDQEAADRKTRLVQAQQQYGRGKPIRVKAVKDKKLRGQLKRLEDKYQDAVVRAKDAEILNVHDSGFIQTEGELERTYKVRQDDIKQESSIETARKGFELKLPGAPYIANYTRNGKSLLLASRAGHVATMEWRDGKLGCELQLNEEVRDAEFLHNELYFAVAQQKYVYIYDHAGIELHKLKNHTQPHFLEFLPYHFLLASVGVGGYLKYTDTSIGHTVIEIPTKKGTPTAFAQNPYNAIIHAGHHNGTVSLWSPNSTSPLVTMLTNRGPVRSIAVDREGRYMVTTGEDLQMAVWDIRTYKEVHKYFLRKPAHSVAISDRGLTAVGWGTSVSIWKDLYSKAHGEAQVKVQSPYLSWGGQGESVQSVRWCPFEDVLGIGHSKGFSSILVPGAGEANFDALELNPYETTKQRQETEVRNLLTKLQPEMISLKPQFIGDLDVASDETKRKERDLDAPKVDPIKDIKNRGRGRNSSLRKHLRKKNSRNILDERKERIEALRKETNRRTRMKPEKGPKWESLGPALDRFVKKAR